MNDLIYENFLKPLLFNLEPELAHSLSLKAFKAIAPIHKSLNLTYKNPLLETKLAGTNIPNPFGMASGFDKNGEYIDLICSLGFGFMEIGSITNLPSMGNPKPRLFRLTKDKALINRMGLNNIGAIKVAKNLEKQRNNFLFGLNIAKSNILFNSIDKEIDDIISAFNILKNIPCLYIALNLSCPNTKDGIIKESDMLSNLLSLINQENTKNIPIFLKLSPDLDLSVLENFIDIAIKHSVNGYICGNTSISRDNLSTDKSTINTIGPGGLSGKPVFKLNLKLVQEVYKLKAKDQEIIGCGGIFCASDAFNYIVSGANALQVYTGIVYNGPGFMAKMNKELLGILGANKFNIASAVGLYHSGYKLINLP